MNYHNYQNQRYKPQGKPERFQPDVDKIKKILNGDAQLLNEYANDLAVDFISPKNERYRLSTSQIRNVLDEIQRMQQYDKTKLQLLRPKLAYAAGRHKGKVKEFRDLIEELLKYTNQDNFQYFKYFIEAIVAYHRYHGGK
ncbi:MAG: type III-A CRISPR-associated protein Csm2 [Candidatus Aminicenantes bacterium]|nr:MAG: type III-A CRISPR-associated protein Csm2 [Candidatus Aminicenantes bacterium]